MNSNQRHDQVFGGVFLIGLAVLFLTDWWWPGIMFALGIALLAKTYAEDKPLTSNTGAWVIIAIGLVFSAGGILNIFSVNWWPLILIAIGLYLLFGERLRGESSGTFSSRSSDDEEKKKKNDIV